MSNTAYDVGTYNHDSRQSKLNFLIILYFVLIILSYFNIFCELETHYVQQRTVQIYYVLYYVEKNIEYLNPKNTQAGT